MNALHQSNPYTYPYLLSHNQLTNHSNDCSILWTFTDNISLFDFVSQVAGLNHFVKIQTDDDSFAHVTIWSKPDGSHHVTKVETGKSKSDQL